MLIALHNIVRWIVVILFIYTLVRIYRGYFSKTAWTETDRKAGTFLMISLDIQMALGLIIYFFVSDLSKTFFSDMGAAMGNAALRFFGMEHVFYMILAIVFGHLGAAAGKKDIADNQKFKRTAVFFTLALVMIALGHVGMEAYRWLPRF